MQCFDWPQNASREVVAICHHCSAALCREHAVSVTENIYANEALGRAVALPRRARLILCRTCKAAFQQEGTHTLTTVS